MNNKQKTGFTLIELIVAVFLLSMVVLTAVTVELSLRKMQVKPEAQTRLLDELTPVLERIKKDFYGQMGSVLNPSLSIEDSKHKVVIRVDVNNDGIPDELHAYRWQYTTTSNPLEYSPNNFTSDAGREVLAQGITDFYVDAPTAYNNTALTIRLKTRKDPSKAENLFTNPGVNLTTTIYSRMTSGR